MAVDMEALLVATEPVVVVTLVATDNSMRDTACHQ